MAKKDKRILGKRELQIMEIVWNLAEATVRQVVNHLEGRQLAYTSVMTMMKNLERKGVLSHREEDRAYFYKPLVSRKEVQRKMLKDLLDSAFQGSYAQLVNALIEPKGLTKEELMHLADEIERTDGGET